MILRVVTSRDVIFEVDEQWEWNASFEKQILLDLEWGDAEINIEEELEAEINKILDQLKVAEKLKQHEMTIL